MDYHTNQAGQQNLLTNSGFWVCSNDDGVSSVGSIITFTDITAGVGTTSETRYVAPGDIVTFATGDFAGEVYYVTDVVNDTSITFADTTMADSGAPGTAYAGAVGYTGANIAAPDGWYKDSTLDVYRVPKYYYSTADILPSGDGYVLLLNPSATNDYFGWAYDINNEQPHISLFKDQVVTLGAWLRTTTSAHAILRIGDGVGVTESRFCPADGNWHWVEVTRHISQSATIPYFECLMKKSSGATYITCPQLSFGTSIGGGQYVPSQEKMIWLTQMTPLQNYTSATVSAASLIDISGDSLGNVIGDIEAVYVHMFGTSTTAGAYLRLSESSSENNVGLVLYSQTTSSHQGEVNGWVRCGPNNTMYINTDGTFTACTIRINGVKMR